MIIFEPNKPRQTYSKQYLLSDEFPYFENGIGQVLIKMEDTHMAPAIYYESIQPTHCENAFKLGANVYLASVAKPANDIEKAFMYYSRVAKQYEMPVLMSNCVGDFDHFLSVGNSAVWTKKGELLGQLDDKTEGILIFDSVTEEATERIIKKSFVGLCEVKGRLPPGPRGVWVESRAEERPTISRIARRADRRAGNRMDYRRSVHTTIDGRGSRRGAPDGCVPPSRATFLLTTDPAPGHSAQQRPHRPQKRPANHRRCFRPARDLTPGMPQPRPDSPSCYDPIDSTLRFHG